MTVTLASEQDPASEMKKLNRPTSTALSVSMHSISFAFEALRDHSWQRMLKGVLVLIWLKSHDGRVGSVF
jgi:hypothetical protein